MANKYKSTKAKREPQRRKKVTNSQVRERLRFLKDRLEFRHKLFLEWLFVDKTLIEDYAKFARRTKEITDEVKKLGDVNVSGDEQ